MTKHHDPVCCIHGRERQARRNAVGDRLFTIARLFESERSRRSVPMIRLRGRWLEQLGFTTGKRIAITTDANRLIITLEETR